MNFQALRSFWACSSFSFESCNSDFIRWNKILTAGSTSWLCRDELSGVWACFKSWSWDYVEKDHEEAEEEKRNRGMNWHALDLTQKTLTKRFLISSCLVASLIFRTFSLLVSSCTWSWSLLSDSFSLAKMKGSKPHCSHVLHVHPTRKNLSIKNTYIYKTITCWNFTHCIHITYSQKIAEYAAKLCTWYGIAWTLVVRCMHLGSFSKELLCA